jgi:hypothetical protein
MQKMLLILTLKMLLKYRIAIALNGDSLAILNFGASRAIVAVSFGDCPTSHLWKNGGRQSPR